MPGTIKELNEITRTFGWTFNPEAPEDDVMRVVDILVEWMEGLVARDRRKRIVRVTCRKNRSKRRRR
jgi:hypothetical protein